MDGLIKSIIRSTAIFIIGLVISMAMLEITGNFIWLGIGFLLIIIFIIYDQISTIGEITKISQEAARYYEEKKNQEKSDRERLISALEKIAEKDNDKAT